MPLDALDRLVVEATVTDDVADLQAPHKAVLGVTELGDDLPSLSFGQTWTPQSAPEGLLSQSLLHEEKCMRRRRRWREMASSIGVEPTQVSVGRRCPSSWATRTDRAPGESRTHVKQLRRPPSVLRRAQKPPITRANARGCAGTVALPGRYYVVPSATTYGPG